MGWTCGKKGIKVKCVYVFAYETEGKKALASTRCKWTGTRTSPLSTEA